MPKTYIVEMITSHINIFKELFGMLESISSEDVNIIFRKDESKEIKKEKQTNIPDDDSDVKPKKKQKSDDTDDQDKKEKKSKKSKKDNGDNNDDDQDKKEKKSKKIKKKYEFDDDDDDDEKKDIKKKKDDKKNIKKDEKKSHQSQNKGGILIKTMSNNQTTISISKLTTTIFDYFYIEQDEISFWINVNELNKFLKSIDPDNYTLNIVIEKNDDKTLKFTAKHNEKESKFKYYEQVMIDNINQINNIPDMNCDYCVSISSQLFKKICTEMKNFADFIEIQCNNNKVLFQCTTKHNKKNVDSYEHNDGDVEILKMNKDNNIQTVCTYYLAHLLKLKYSTNICDNIVLHLKTKAPLFIKSNIFTTIDEKNVACGIMLVYFSPYDDELDNGYHNKMKDCYKDIQPDIKE